MTLEAVTCPYCGHRATTINQADGHRAECSRDRRA